MDPFHEKIMLISEEEIDAPLIKRMGFTHPIVSIGNVKDIFNIYCNGKFTIYANQVWSKCPNHVFPGSFNVLLPG